MSHVAPSRRRLLAIGGAEDKLGAKRVLRRFVSEAGGKHARLLVCPTASALGEEVIALYDELFTKLGVAEVIPVRPEDRAEAHKPAMVEAVGRATGIFLTGGNQMKLAAILRGTPFGEAIRAAYERGVIIAGTSAGASAMSEHMIGYGASGHTPKHRIAGMAQGLGLLPGTVVDQHFAQRDRFGRLIAVVAASPDLLGIGLDEDTAVLVSDEESFEVVGSGSVFCVDLRGATSDADTARGTAPLMVSGATVHFLPAGSHFDLNTRTLVPAHGGNRQTPSAVLAGSDLQVGSHQAPEGDAQLERGALAEADQANSPNLASLSRRVAAEGVDDAVVARNARRRRRASQSKEAR